MNIETRIQRNVPLCDYTTFRVGGPSDYFLSARSAQETADAMAFARERGLPVLVMGNGSNLLVRDGGFRGLTVRLGPDMADIGRAGDTLCAGAGAPLAALARRAQAEGLSGLEFAQGIPGTVGGGVYMNAGAYGSELGARVTRVRLLSQSGDVYERSRAEMDFGYRHSAAMDRGDVVLEAEFLLTPDDPAAIAARADDFARRRREKQPLSLPSAGSFFKRPQGHFAGALIEEAGLKGRSVGGAQVSPMHAGFIVNTGGARAADILALMRVVQDEVFRRFGVRLEPEVRVVGEDGGAA